MFAALLTISLLPTLVADAPPVSRPGPTRDDEPLARAYSPAKAAEYLDGVGVNWTRDRKCITCHTNMPYLTARPLLPGDKGWKEVRAFLERDVESWSNGGKPRGPAYVVATAFALAFNDTQDTGKLHGTTRAALDKMWEVQRKAGNWSWLKCDWPPLEHDDYYGATLAALAVGYAPGDYAGTEKARAGIELLKGYFKQTPPPDLHHAAMLLWASTRLEGLMTPDQQKKAIAALKARQHKDGGWALAALGEYTRHPQARVLGFPVGAVPNDPGAPGDGYGTGFATFVLLQAGVPPTDPAVANGVKWIKANQRESGRWFTRSVSNDRAHYIANAGTAFCVLALSKVGTER